MVRLLKFVAFTFALVVLSIAATSCNTGGIANVRLINAIPNATSALDVDFNGSTVNSPALAFDGVYPSAATPAKYFGASTGLVTVEAFYSGQTTSNPILDSTTTTLTGGDYYTMVFGGFAPVPAAYVISDTIIAPTAGTVKIRMINASASSSETYPQGFDIYILPPGQTISGIPTITGVTLGQSGPGYITLNYIPSYTVWVTPNKSTLPLFNTAYPQTNQQIMTLVIVDQAGATLTSPAVSSTMLDLIDQQ